MVRLVLIAVTLCSFTDLSFGAVHHPRAESQDFEGQSYYQAKNNLLDRPLIRTSEIQSNGLTKITNRN